MFHEKSVRFKPKQYKQQRNEPNVFRFQYKEFTKLTLLHRNLIIPLTIKL